MAEAYLDLMELVLTGVLIEDPPIVTKDHRRLFRSIAESISPGADPDEAEMARFQFSWREQGLDWPTHGFTMVGLKRLRNFRALIDRVVEEGVPGDVLETGVWRGGASILARAVLRAWGETGRRVVVADSFAGLPPPDPSYPQDSQSILHEYAELAVSLETVRANFAKFGLLDDQVVFLKGWFRDTMPRAPIARLAVMRLDGDMYESTIDPLKHLYDRLSPGGWVIVDDYFIPACKAAVTDFLGERSLSPAIHDIDGMGVYFQKTE
jgi:Macrocin-O-methyltransferase (TylF)